MPTDDLPRMPSPPLAPELPWEPADAARAPALEVKANAAEPVIAVPVSLLRGFSASSDALAHLVEQPVVAAVVEALGAKPADVASAARGMSTLAGDALAGRWQAPTAEAARHAEVVHLTRARRHRPRPAVHPVRPSALTVHLLTADEIRTTAATARAAAQALAKEAADPERAEALRAAGFRLDLIEGMEANAARLEADAEWLARHWRSVEEIRRHLTCSIRPDESPPAA